MDYNADGQRHADWYVELAKSWVPLRDLNGVWTGHGLDRDQLRYTDAEKARAAKGWSGHKEGFPRIDGLARLDFHEWFGPLRLENGRFERLALHRGGTGYLDASEGMPPGSAVKYGMIAESDVDDPTYPLPAPFPSGDGRGAGAPARDGLFAMRPRPTPHMLYKGPLPDGTIPWGSLWWTYSDMGGEWGGDVHYMPLCWSFLNVGGGGMVRGILRDGHRVRALDVPRATCGVYTDTDGARIGDMRGQYVRTSSRACGWVPWAFRTVYTGSDWIYLAEQVS